MEMKSADKITRTITARTINYAFLTDELEVKKGRTVVFGSSPVNLPDGAKIISTSIETFKCSMSLEKFFELCEKGCDCKSTKLKILADGRTIKAWKGMEPVWIRWDTIHEAYKQPSIKKLKAWERIEENARNLEATVGINSKNCDFFTVHGFMLDEEGRSVDFKLTKSYCYFRYRY